MRRILGGSGLLALAASLMLGTMSRAEDEKAKKIPLDRAPKAVRDAIHGRFPGALVNSLEKETENGKVVYDVELKQKGRKYEMDIQEDGTIIEIEKEIALKDVSPAVLRAVKAKFPKAVIKEVMEVNKVKGKEEKPVHYEITIQTADKKQQEVVVSLDGKSIKKEGEEKETKEKK
jgi:uncharacterized membrane protein YkoI